MMKFSFKWTYPVIIAMIACLISACTGSTENANKQGASAASQQEMQTLLADVRRKMNHPDNPFASEARLAFLENSIKTSNDPAQQLNLQFIKAATLLENGEEARAVALYEHLLKFTGGNSEARKKVLSGLGISYMRLAERNNCIQQHASEACIMPIRGNGIHQDKVGARKAASIYETMLAEDPGDQESRWLLNIAYMTLGEYPGKVPAKWLIRGLDDKGRYSLNPFAEIAADLGINTNDCSGGSIVDDFDNDGFLDIVTSSWRLSDPMHFYRNNGDGTFTDRSAESGLHDVTGGLNLSSADFNNDGRLDILVLRGAWEGQSGFGAQPNSLLRNNGDGTFTDVTVEAGIYSTHPTQTATWNDFNNDGWLDVFIGNETTLAASPQPCELYLNRKDGTFTEVAASAGLQITSFVKGVVSGDYDNDGWADIFISTLNGQQMLFRNLGAGREAPSFENVSEKAGFNKGALNTFPTGFFDYDNDGWLDIFVCNYDFDRTLAANAATEARHPSNDMSGKVKIYHNEGNGTFTDVTSAVFPNVIVFAMGVNFGDINNDGYLDLYFGTGNPNYRSLVPNKMFLNVKGEKFVDVTTAARVGNLQKGHGISFADIDNDGDRDIYEDMGGAFRGDAYFSTLYMNPGQGNNHWLYLQLKGATSNRSAVGAKLTLYFRENGTERKIYREVNSGASFGCSPLRREIGVGQAALIDSLTVDWPASGIKQVFQNVQPGQLLLITEGEDHYRKLPLNPIVFRKADGTIPMCAPVR